MKKIILLVLSFVLITGISCSKKSIDLTKIMGPEEFEDQNESIAYKYKIISCDGKFLGNLGREYFINSVYNSNGRYGSSKEEYSLRNKNGIYGDGYSSKSPFNFFATELPKIYDREGNCYGALSINKDAPGVTDFSYETTLILKWLIDESNKLNN